jgi:hypothetical protein
VTINLAKHPKLSARDLLKWQEGAIVLKVSKNNRISFIAKCALNMVLGAKTMMTIRGTEPGAATRTKPPPGSRRLQALPEIQLQ